MSVKFFLFIVWSLLSTAAMTNDVTKLKVQYQNQTIELEKINKVWEVGKINNQAVKDRRANQGFTSHYIDLLNAKKDVLTSDQVLKLLRAQSVLDFRDRRIFTFETDDVEELKTEGSCPKRHVMRDGDRWVWRGLWQDRVLTRGLGTKQNLARVQPTNQSAAVDAWLDAVLSIRYEEENAQSMVQAPDLSHAVLHAWSGGRTRLKSSTHKNAFCHVTLIGRKNRKEDVFIEGSLRGKEYTYHVQLHRGRETFVYTAKAHKALWKIF